MWQFRVEIEGYSVAYFERNAAFQAPYQWTSGKGGADMRFVDSLDFHASSYSNAAHSKLESYWLG